MDIPEQHLLAAARRGEQNALARLSTEISRYVLFRTGGPCYLAKELAAETLVNLLTAEN